MMSSEEELGAEAELGGEEEVEEEEATSLSFGRSVTVCLFCFTQETVSF